MEPSSAKATQAHREITPPRTQTRRNNNGCGRGLAMSFAVRKIEEPIMPPASSNTESSNDRPRTRVGVASEGLTMAEGETVKGSIIYPIPSSSGDSSGVPQRRQITAEQSPQVRGSMTSWLHRGQYSGSGSGSGCGVGVMRMANVAYPSCTLVSFGV